MGKPTDPISRVSRGPVPSARLQTVSLLQLIGRLERVPVSGSVTTMRLFPTSCGGKRKMESTMRAWSSEAIGREIIKKEGLAHRQLVLFWCNKVPAPRRKKKKK